MGDIYRCASRSILWLGRDTNPELSAVLRRAARFGNAVNAMVQAFRKVRKSTGDEEFERGYWQLPVLSVAESERIADLCANEWFGRMWTIQEFLLSKSAIFLMGNVKCPSLALYTYYRLGKELVKRADLEHYRMRNALSNFSPSSTDGFPFKKFMAVIIQLAALNSTTDARDKVYGMVAFLKNKWPDLQLPAVDYAKSVADIYEHFTRSLIATTRSLWPLGLVNGLSGSESHDLLSWVLDLRDPDCLAPDWELTFEHQGFSRGQHKSPMQVYNLGQLSVRAKRIGNVTRTSMRMPFWGSKSRKRTAQEMDLARTACLSEWTAFVTNLDMHKDQTNSPYIHHASSKERRRFFKWEQVGILCSDPNTRALEAFTRELDYLRLRHELEDEISVDSWPFESEKRSKRKRKKRKAEKKKAEEDSSYLDEGPRAHDKCLLFLMSTGHLAESPGDVLVGDSVYIIEGSGFQFVLRHRNKQFLVVGKADIYLMTLQGA
ncbi:hypothetical protein N431DRAFT_481462 [Stipitochalara longipes BDJ]|nr:hypothetical protein N431DRAFT_481462 [Stipitochalara longipes BDJ]